MTRRPGVGAIGVVLRDGHVLLVQRGKEPDRGLWGFPGGHVEWGETGWDAAVREVAEETGVEVRALRSLTPVDVIRHGDDGAVRSHFVLLVVFCEYVSGAPVAADDAADARWVALDALTDLPLTPRVMDVLREAGA